MKELEGDGFIGALPLARLLSVSQKHIRRMHHEGKMPSAYAIGATLRWSKREIREWLSSSKMTPGDRVRARARRQTQNNC